MGGKSLSVIGSISLLDPLGRYSSHTMKRPYYEILLLPRCECIVLSHVYGFDDMISKVRGLDLFRYDPNPHLLVYFCLTFQVTVCACVPSWSNYGADIWLRVSETPIFDWNYPAYRGYFPCCRMSYLLAVLIMPRTRCWSMFPLCDCFLPSGFLMTSNRWHVECALGQRWALSVTGSREGVALRWASQPLDRR